MADLITMLGDSIIQHGPENDRIYLMKLAEEDLPTIVEDLADLARREEYSKIFAKVPKESADPFLDAGFRIEAEVPGLFQGEVDAAFLGYYLDPLRGKEPSPREREEVLAAALKRQEETAVVSPPAGVDCRPLEPDDAPAMAELYAKVFASYPFPIDDPDYLQETMDANVHYFGGFAEGRLVALSSAEVDVAGRHAEMTDFATHPDFRGGGVAGHLLGMMEEQVGAQGVATAYTIARAYSYGMNITFARGGYRFGGTLTANTQIGGGLESMNVWYKSLTGVVDGSFS